MRVHWAPPYFDLASTGSMGCFLMTRFATIRAALAPLYRSAGWFTHRGVKIAHVGAVVEQVSVCNAIDGAILAITAAHPETAAPIVDVLRATWIRIYAGAAFEIDGAVLQTRLDRLPRTWLMNDRRLLRIAAEPHVTIEARVRAQLLRAWPKMLGVVVAKGDRG